MKGKKTGGGSRKGKGNKLTQEAREMFIETLEGEVPKIKKAFDAVFIKDKAKYLELFCKYAQYFVPRKVDVTSDDKPVEQTFKFGDQIINF